MPRTNIAVDEETADHLADEASRENKSLYALTNEALAAVIKICNEHFSYAQHREVLGSLVTDGAGARKKNRGAS